MAEAGIDPRFFYTMESFVTLMADTLPRNLFRAFKRGLFGEGVEFKKRFRENLNSRFKIKKSKVGNLFKVYTAGDRLGNLVLGVFTIWDAAPTYESGGTISSASGGWLLVALDKAAYTAGGRIKRSWRDPTTGKWARDKLEDLAWVPVKNGRGYLLYEQTHQVTSAAQARATGVNVGQFRAMAAKPRFLLIRQTKRMPLLKFMADFFAFVAQSGGLDQALGRSLEAAEKLIGGE